MAVDAPAEHIDQPIESKLFGFEPAEHLGLQPGPPLAYLVE